MLQGESFLRLRVESRVLNEGIYEDPEMTLDLEWLDTQVLVLFLKLLLDTFDDLIDHHVDVCSSLGSTNTVDERDLLELSI